MRWIKRPVIFDYFKYTPFPNLKLIYFLLIPQIFIVPFVEAPSVGGGSFLAWLYMGAVVTLIVLAITYLYKSYCDKTYGNEVPVNRIYLGGLLIGIFKGSSTQYLVNLIGIKDPTPLDDIGARGFSGGCLGLILAFLLSLNAVYAEEAALFRQRLVQGERLLVEDIGFLGKQIDVLKRMTKDDLITSITKNFSQNRQVDLSTIDPEKNWKIISESLRHEIAKSVRDESHELGHLNLKPLSTKNQIWKIISSQRIELHPLLFGFLYYTISFGPAYQNWQSGANLLKLLINTTIAVVVIAILKKVLPVRSKVKRFQGLVTVLGTSFVNCLLFTLVASLLDFELSLANLFNIFFFQVVLFISISIFTEFVKNIEKIKDLDITIRGDLLNKQKILSEYYATMRHEISRHLHGYLVAKTMTTAHLLDNFAASGDFESYGRELRLLLDEFTFQGLQNSLNKVRLSAEYISFIQLSWNGLIEIRLDIPDDLDQKLVLAQRVELAHVLDELITNAYRHGMATLISITIKWSDDGDLEISAIDNGKGEPVAPLEAGGGGGLGSQLFDSASNGRWDRINLTNQGVAVRLTITPHHEISEVLNYL